MKNLLPSIFEITYPKIEELIPGFPRYRYSQFLDWIYKKWIFDTDLMSNLPTDFRVVLNQKVMREYPTIVEKQTTSDNTTKFLFKLHDGDFIEAVIIDSIKRKTFCLSTQVGCPIQCKFCASGMHGFKRNLTVGEIVGQFLLLAKFLKKAPDNLVFMGIGEPLLNFQNLVESLEIISSSEYIGFSQRRITISTSGIPENIRKLASLKRQYNLAISLHSTDDLTRAKLIPDKVRYPIQEIVDAALEYFRQTGRLLTIEYVLIKGINDTLLQAKELARIAKRIRAKVNLIPYNLVKESPFLRPDDKSSILFAKTLEDTGVPITFRIEKGANINAACGQLRADKISG